MNMPEDYLLCESHTATATTTGSGIVEIPRSYTIRTPDEILSMVFDDSARILGDSIIEKGQPTTILGAGGIGKSRFVFQLIASCVTGRRFLNFDTNGQDLKCLVMQSENSNRRLQGDLTKLRAWCGDDWPKFTRAVRIHTLENDDDGFVSLAHPENKQLLENAIADFSPDVVVFDPLGDFGIGDLNTDDGMRNTCHAIGRTVRKGNPERAIIILHHAITGRAGSAKATGFDRASFGRNSKVLQAWTRAQINIAPGEADSNDVLVVACGKCSNGIEFSPFAVRLNPSTMIYEVDPHFDLEAWKAEVTGAKAGPSVTIEDVRKLCRGAMSRQDLAQAIIKDAGVTKQYAYRLVKKAEKAKQIVYSNATERYVSK